MKIKSHLRVAFFVGDCFLFFTTFKEKIKQTNNIHEKNYLFCYRFFSFQCSQ